MLIPNKLVKGQESDDKTIFNHCFCYGIVLEALADYVQRVVEDPRWLHDRSSERVPLRRPAGQLLRQDVARARAAAVH